RAPARAVPPAHQADVLHAVFGAVLPRAPGALVVPRPGGGPGPALPRRAGARAAAEACPAGAGGLIGPGAGLLNADAPVEPVPQPPTHGARWNVPARSKTERRTVGRRLEDAPTAAAVAPVDPGARGARPIHRRRTRLRVDPDTGHGVYPRSIRTRRGCVLHRLSPGTAHLLDHQYRGRAARAGAFAIAALVGGSGRDRGSSRADRAADDHVRVLRPVGKARGECVLVRHRRRPRHHPVRLLLLVGLRPRAHSGGHPFGVRPRPARCAGARCPPRASAPETAPWPYGGIRR